MESKPHSIQIETQMELKDFMRLIFFLTYRRPMVLIVTILGFFVTGWGILALAGIIEFSAFSPGFTLFYGLFFLFWIPVAAYFRGKKQYASSKRSQELRKFEFTMQAIHMESESSNNEYKWASVYEVRFSGKWLLIFLSRSEAIFIPQNAFTAEKLAAFRTLVGKINGLKVRG
ncbi:MAG: hypothetical protein RLZZ519_1015 [Bacteroidota bacterium]|jgi:hypothetical protein